jgi:uncharacterized protein YbjT (DUF2867 family)
MRWHVDGSHNRSAFGTREGESRPTFAITGITGNVGGEVARNLIAAGRPVRAVMRDVRKGEVWGKRGCDLVGADINEVAALTTAFTKVPDG